MTIHERARAAWAEVPLPALSARRVFVRDLRLDASIGIHPAERVRLQPVVINLDLWVREAPDTDALHYADVVCYEQLVNRTKDLLKLGHIDLVETLAERLAALCLEDARVERVRVRVEKPEAIAVAAGVGVEIERHRG